MGFFARLRPRKDTQRKNAIRTAYGNARSIHKERGELTLMLYLLDLTGRIGSEMPIVSDRFPIRPL